MLVEYMSSIFIFILCANKMCECDFFSNLICKPKKPFKGINTTESKAITVLHGCLSKLYNECALSKSRVVY